MKNFKSICYIIAFIHYVEIVFNHYNGLDLSNWEIAIPKLISIITLVFLSIIIDKHFNLEFFKSKLNYKRISFYLCILISYLTYDSLFILQPFELNVNFPIGLIVILLYILPLPFLILEFNLFKINELKKNYIFGLILILFSFLTLNLGYKLFSFLGEENYSTYRIIVQLINLNGAFGFVLILKFLIQKYDTTTYASNPKAP